jgi:uncharacterized iron-regulated membrane protein|tara:strand:+ start:204 stop:962 length:759 start_codon:yes stop_codon:yes gene_type:complete
MLKSYKSWHISLIQHLRAWHRRLGIIAAFFLIFLSLSGIALNHTELLSLGHQKVNIGWLQDHYGIKAPDRVNFYNNNELIVTDKLVWLKDRLLMEVSEPVMSAGKFQQFIVVASEQQLFVFTQQGELVDKLGTLSGLPSNINAMSISPTTIIINTDNGYYQSDSDLFEWQSISTIVEPKWINETQATAEQKISATSQYKAQFLTWERIIVDTHSGRFFGLLGVLFMDVVAILLILLSVSGLYIWLRYAKGKR